MSILILAVHRTGSSSLLESISKQGYEQTLEPFGPYHNTVSKYSYPLSIKNNMVVKHIVDHIPNGIDKTYIEICKEMSEQFDKVIILDRRNIEQHLLSIINLWYRLEVSGEHIHSRWYHDELPKDFINQFIQANKHQDLYNQKSKIQRISKILNVDISWYEDLYGEDRNKSLDIIKSWNLNINEELLNEDLHPKWKGGMGTRPSPLF